MSTRNHPFPLETVCRSPRSLDIRFGPSVTTPRKPPPIFFLLLPFIVCVHVNAEGRGLERHVCAMRVERGTSLFHGRSDVLFHPRRQSCRTTETCNTIVSKFSSHIARSHTYSLFYFLSLSLSSFLAFFVHHLNRDPI